MRTVLRWCKRVVLAALAVVAIAIVATLVVLHTDWGRERLRRQVEAALAKSFPGGAHVGRLEGSVLGDLVLRDVELRDATGQPTVIARAVRVNLRYGALLHGELALETLVLDGIDLRVRAIGGEAPNVATLYQPSPEPGTWDIAVERLEVRAGAITIDRGAAGVDHLDDVTVTADVRLAAAGPLVAHGQVAAIWRERAGAALTASADVAVDAAGVVTVAHARIGVERATITATAVRYGGPGAFEGQVRIVAPPGELARLVPEAALPALAVDLDVHAAARPDGVVELRLGGGAGGATIDGTLAVRPQARRVDGTLELAAIDLARLSPGLPPSELAATMTLALASDPAALGLAAVTGTATLAGHGTVAQVALDQLGVTLEARAGAVTVAVTGRGPGPTAVTATGTVRATAEGYQLDDGALTAAIGSIAAATRGAVPADGALDVALTGGGMLDGDRAHVDVRGTIDGRDLVVGVGRARTVALTVAAAGAPAALSGDVRLVASGLRWDRRPLPSVTVTARGPLDARGPIAVQLEARDRARAVAASVGATVVRTGAGDDGRTRVGLGRYRIATAGVELVGAGGELVVAPARLTVRGVRARAAGGAIAIDGEVGLGPGLARRAGTVTITDVDLARLRGLPGVPAIARGVIAGRATLRQRGRAVTGEVAVTGLGVVVAAGAQPIELAVTAEVSPRTVTLALDGRGPDVGALTVAATVTPPRRLDDLAGWRRLERAAVRAVRIEADALDLGAIARLTGGPATVTGTIATTVTADPDRAELAIRGRGLAMTGAPAPLDLDVTVIRDGAAPAQIQVDAVLRGLGTAHVAGAVRAPARPFDLTAWRALDVTAVDGLTATLDDVTIDAALARALGQERLRGTVGGAVTASAGLRTVEVRVDARDLIGGPLTAPVTVTAVAHADGRGLDATVDLGLAGRPLATVAATAPTTLPELLAGTASLRTLPLHGTIALRERDVATIARALGQPTRISGRVSGAGDLTGTLDAPVATAALVVTDLGARAARGGGRARGGLRQLDVDLRYQPGALHGEVRGRQDDGGALDLTVDLDPAEVASARASIGARRFQVAPLARLAPTLLLGVRGVLDADLQLRGGTRDRALLVGVAQVSGVQVPLADTIGTLRDGTIDATFAAGSAHVTAAGAVEAGRVELEVSAVLAGLVPRTLSIDVGVRALTMITSLAPKLDGDLHVELDMTQPRWTATARVRDGTVDISEGGGRALHPAGAPLDLVFTTDTSVTAPLPLTRATVLRTWMGTRPTVPLLVLSLAIEPVAVVSPRFRGDVGGDLTVTVGADGAAVDGTIAVARGTVLVLERRYDIRRAQLVFDGALDPLLDVEIEYQFPQLVLQVRVDQRYSKPRVRLASVPDKYTEGQLLAFLMGGSPTSAGNETVDAATGVAASVAASVVGASCTRRCRSRSTCSTTSPAPRPAAGRSWSGPG
ncbi:MAG: translocation/assembly module TamB domain-containing protein [Myxococcales bacterium]|nr:translocation/assembly module TamB domain-containing protein [Myxococcales bacterium]